MALAFGAQIGTQVGSGVSTVTITTTGAVAVGGHLVVGVSYYNAVSVTSITATGGLTLTQDILATPNADANYHIGLYSCPCPSGLASGSSITLTLSGSAFSVSLCAEHWTGVATSSWADATNSATASNNTWGAALNTTNADDAIVAYGFGDFSSGTSNPTASYTEDADFLNGLDANCLSMVHRIVAATSTYTPGGTFTDNGVPSITAAVAYKAAAGGGAAAQVPYQPQYLMAPVMAQ